MKFSPRIAWDLSWFALTVLVSAFLVFQVQPVVSKALLPWFGGSPAVWTTCMLFFQTVLFAGYAYAHFLTRWPLHWQGRVHLVLIVLALWALPVVPEETWKPTGLENPTWDILLILLANVGLPYFVLSSTGPLMQAWFRHSTQGSSPYRLYALSNAGSLAALLSYPFLIEPSLTTAGQSRVWSLGFCLFGLLCGYLATRRLSASGPSGAASPSTAHTAPARRPGWRAAALWMALPAFASLLLLATTNHVCQDVAVVPFLWVVPLSLYLLTFILCFDHDRWYSRRICALGAVLSVVALSAMIRYGYQQVLVLEAGLYILAMFFLCMLCHGELARSKPDARHLTMFYLMASAGGALGGFLVAVVCPLVFSTNLEMSLAVLGGTVLGMGMVLSDAERRGWGGTWQRHVIFGLLYFAVFAFVGLAQFDATTSHSLASMRNFYGVLRVEGGDELPAVALVHGRVIHGLQFQDDRKNSLPTTYYSPDSGVGMVLRRNEADAPVRVGAIGLGCGTIAAYGRPADYYRFYEINPAVIALAHDYFSYLRDCPAETELVLGDARISLEREPPQQFDVLVLDAFSGDAIPTHLLTREAFAVYLRHLKPDGVLAVHVSNRHLRLEGVVGRLAQHYDLPCISRRSPSYPRLGIFASNWMLLGRTEQALAQRGFDLGPAPTPARTSPTTAPLWTDQYSNLFQILTVFHSAP